MDAQDNEDGRLLHERLAPAMIACGFADVQDGKPAVSKKSCASCASMLVNHLPLPDFEPVFRHLVPWIASEAGEVTDQRLLW